MTDLVVLFFIAIAMVYVPFILLLALAFILVWRAERKAGSREPGARTHVFRHR